MQGIFLLNGSVRRKNASVYLSTAGTHTELCLLSSCQEGHKHLCVPQDSHSDRFIEGQENGVQGCSSEAQIAPAPSTNSGS